MKGALMGALGMKPSTPNDETDPNEAEPDADADDAEPNDLELAAAEEFQKATKTGTPADVVRAFRGLKSACEADYGKD